MQANPRPGPAQPRGRGAHLRLVADQGRLVDPDFQPEVPVWVTAVAARIREIEGAGRMPGADAPSGTSTAAGRGGTRHAARPDSAARVAPASAVGLVSVDSAALGPGPAIGRAPGDDARSRRKARPAPRLGRLRPRRGAVAAGGVRLTRRGRLVITVTLMMLVAVASMVLAGTAHAGIL
ncbi:MAG TPA: hypothetical protein VH478_26610 [Trebonia sp.]|nr:hypothetical protein [Trebonia sp.]